MGEIIWKSNPVKGAAKLKSLLTLLNKFLPSNDSFWLILTQNNFAFKLLTILLFGVNKRRVEGDPLW